jgi:hypothetical protein
MSERITVRAQMEHALLQIDACAAARTWIREGLKRGTVAGAWAACQRPEWLLWLCGKLGEKFPYYKRAGAAAMAAMIDVLVVECRNDFDSQGEAFAYDVSALLDRYGQTGRLPVAKANKFLEQRARLDYDSKLFGELDALVFHGLMFLRGSPPRGMKCNEWGCENYIIECGAVLDEEFCTREYDWAAESWKSIPNTLGKKLAREVRRVVERPTLDELKKAAG